MLTKYNKLDGCAAGTPTKADATFAGDRESGDRVETVNDTELVLDTSTVVVDGAKRTALSKSLRQESNRQDHQSRGPHHEQLHAT